MRLFKSNRTQEKLARIEGGLVATEIALLEEMTGKPVDDPESYLVRKAKSEFGRKKPGELDMFLAGGLETLDELHQ